MSEISANTPTGQCGGLAMYSILSLSLCRHSECSVHSCCVEFPFQVALSSSLSSAVNRCMLPSGRLR